MQFSKETFLFFINTIVGINNFDDFEVHLGQNHLLTNFVKKNLFHKCKHFDWEISSKISFDISQ